MQFPFFLLLSSINSCLSARSQLKCHFSPGNIHDFSNLVISPDFQIASFHCTHHGCNLNVVG